MLREQLGQKRLRFNDDQRRRLAVRAKGLGVKLSPRGGYDCHARDPAGLASPVDRAEIMMAVSGWGYPSLIILGDVYSSHVTRRKSDLDLSFACCPAAREPAELSPQTFCTFPREFSSDRRQRVGTRSYFVLEPGSADLLVPVSRKNVVHPQNK